MIGDDGIVMPDEQSLIAEALRLKAENPSWGYQKIAQSVPGMDRHKVRRAVEHAERKQAKLPAIIAPNAGLPALSFYDTARQALAQAKTLAEVNDLADKGAAIREYARRAKDRQLQADAQEIIWRAERRLGEMVIHIKKTTGLDPGGRPSKGDKFTGPNLEPVSAPLSLDEIGVDKKLSSRAQKLASISERAIEARIAAQRENVERGGRVATDLLRDGPLNGARSVMASRVDRDDHALDFYPTAPWATRALFEHVMPRLGFLWGGDHKPRLVGGGSAGLGSVWEPACGEGHMLKVIEEYTDRADGSDIHDYGGMGADSIIDFVDGHNLDHLKYDWIITNPPFKDKLTERFVLRALDLAQVGVAMFVRSQWAVEGVYRYNAIFRDRPATLHAYFAERVNLCVGRWDPDGGTATAYCWLVWVRDRAPMAPFYIPPGCRESLTRPDDRARFAAWSMPEAAE